MTGIYPKQIQMALEPQILRLPALFPHCPASLIRPFARSPLPRLPVKILPMLTKRIIPCLDVSQENGRGRVVKGVKFFDHVDAGDPVEQAVFYDHARADELVFYDITA